MLVVSLQGSFDQVKQTMRDEARYAEGFEFRLDLMDCEVGEVSKLRSLAKLPVIFTLRRKDQGGAFQGNERMREELLLEHLKAKPDFVDLEWDSLFAEKVDPSIQVIASYHDFEKTPDDLDKIIEEMDRFPCAIKKLATMAHSTLDSLRMLQCVQKRGVAGMCMGEAGEITRVLAPLVDAPLTYASSGEEIAPGQLPAKLLVELYRFHQLNRQTKAYGVIGDPVNRSIGFLCHNAIFKKMKENRVYVRMPLKRGEVPEFFKRIKTLPFFGLSVTMPHKEEVGKHLDEIRTNCGAINTIVREGERWVGTNTDGIGALDALGDVEGKWVMILGAGGAARAIAKVAEERGAKLIIANRTLKKAEILAKEVGGMAIPLEKVGETPYDILMNTTAVGMAPEGEKIPISKEAIREKCTLFDVIQNPRETAFLMEGRRKNCRIVHGYEMYTRQALQQQQIWQNRSLNESEILGLIESFVFFR